jgi:ribosome-associated heat shock protein Hsp15
LNPLSTDRIRIDKWLWAARFFKTRSLATDEVQAGRVLLGGQSVKASRDVRIGDTLEIWQAKIPRTVVVTGVSDQRGSAPQAALLYTETAESLARRAALAEQRRISPEPANAIAHGRPTKRDRRQLDKGWGDRWSATLD